MSFSAEFGQFLIYYIGIMIAICSFKLLTISIDYLAGLGNGSKF